jgi:type I restriction enzyme S subunit
VIENDRRWFGGLPPDWSDAPIDYHFDVVLGKMINAKNEVTGGISAPYLAAGSIQPDHLLLDDTKRMDFSMSELRRYSLKRDDIVVVEGGAGYGRSHLLKDDLVGWGFQNHVARVRQRSGAVLPEFLVYVLKACLASGFIEANNRTATLPSLSSDVLGAIIAPMPSPDEQHAIADYLDQETAQIDALVAKQEEFIRLLHERRRAVVEHALSRIEANRAALRHFSVLVSGSGFPVDLQGRADLELPFFKVANLKSADRDGVLVRSEHTIDRSTAKALRATVIPKGALVFAKVGAALLLGRVGALPDDGCIDNNMSALIFDESIDLKFARYLVLTFDFREFVLPGPVPSLDMEGLREFKVPVLSLDRQRVVADSLDEETSRIDTLIEKAEEHIALARERRAALITAAVTGQFDVRTARKAG